MIVETVVVILVSFLANIYYYGRAPKPLSKSETERPNPGPAATPEILRAMIEGFEEKLPITPDLRTELILDDKCEKEKASSLLLRRLEERVEYGVPKMADFEKFKEDTVKDM